MYPSIFEMTCSSTLEKSAGLHIAGLLWGHQDLVQVFILTHLEQVHGMPLLLVTKGKSSNCLLVFLTVLLLLLAYMVGTISFFFQMVSFPHSHTQGFD